MRQHELKTWPPFFRAVLDGRKTFEARRDDRGFDVGDELVLQEFEPAGMGGNYTGHRTTVRVTYILRGGDFGIERGFVVMGIGKPDPERRPDSPAPRPPRES